MNMNIRIADKSDIEELLKFNQMAFPNRTFTKEFIEYRMEVDENQQERALFYIAEYKGKIIGQRVMLREDWLFNEQKHQAYWGTDFFVHPNFQGKGLGKKIINHIQNELPLLFSTNTGKITKSIYKKLDYQVVGYLNLYFKPLRLLPFMSLITRVIIKKEQKTQERFNSTDFPRNVKKFKRKTWENINHDLESIEKATNLLLGTREPSYMKWRYFYKNNPYKFYQHNQNSAYFIARTICWKGVNCLMIVDMRYAIEDKKTMKELLSATNQLAKELNSDAILTSSSIDSMKKMLKKNLYLNYSSNQIITNFQADANDLKVMMHFSDSDLDFNYSNTPFVYG